MTLSVVISGLPGGPYTYAGGADMGDYVDPAGDFVQHCLKATSNACPLVVYFREDADLNPARAEVVIEYPLLQTSITNDTTAPKPADLPPYTVTITQGSAAFPPITLTVPHKAGKRWRWQSAPRPVRVKVSDLIASGKVLPYTQAPKTVANPGSKYTILGLSGITPYMPTTGERADIGPLAQSGSDYCRQGDDASLQTVLDWAESAGTIPWHVRDASGSPLNFDNTPHAGWDTREGTNPTLIGSADEEVNIDGAHCPSLSYLAFLLTGDPYYLEELQFQASWWFCAAYSSVYSAAGASMGVSTNTQVRGRAWTLRDLVHACAATPDNVPSWLLPRAYLRTKLANNLVFFTGLTIDNPDPRCQAFHTVAVSGTPPQITMWESQYLITTFALAARLFPEWGPVFGWAAQEIIDLTSPTSGWPRQQGVPYWTNVVDADGNAITTFAALAAANGFPVADPGVSDVSITADNDYDDYGKGTIALAVAAGLPGAAEGMAWFDSADPASLTLKYAFDALAPDPAKVEQLAPVAPETQATTAPSFPPISGPTPVTTTPTILSPDTTDTITVKVASYVKGTPFLCLGDGKTVVKWDSQGYSGPAVQPDGTAIAQDVHANGEELVLQYCASLIVGGKTIDLTQLAGYVVTPPATSAPSPATPVTQTDPDAAAIAALTTRVAALEAAVSAIQVAPVPASASDLAALQTMVSGIASSVSTLQSAPPAATADALTQLGASIAAIQATVASIGADVATLKSDIAAIKAIP